MTQNCKNFNLNSNDRSIIFSLKDCSASIFIQRIVIDNLVDSPKDEWFYKLYKLNICLEISELGEYRLPLNKSYFTFMSIDSIPEKPIYHFENEFIIPGSGFRKESHNEFCKEVKIELKTIKGQLDENISLTFYFEASAGVIWKN